MTLLIPRWSVLTLKWEINILLTENEGVVGSNLIGFSKKNLISSLFIRNGNKCDPGDIAVAFGLCLCSETIRFQYK